MKRSWVALVAIAPLVAFVAAFGFKPSHAKIALGWNLSAGCGANQHVVGSIDIPSNESGRLPFNVFVEWQSSDGGWHWVTDAGQDINHTGTQSFDMDVSKTPADAVWLRVRYKQKLSDPNSGYGREISTLFAPCFPPLHVFDLQAECTDVANSVYGGMIGVPSDAAGFPWTVFMEYQGLGSSIPYAEDWHWVSGTGVKIGPSSRGSNNNFEFRNVVIPSGVTELRVRYKSGESSPWIYGPEISAIFAPCKTPMATPTNTPVPPTSTSTTVPLAPTNTPVPPAPTIPPVKCTCIQPPNTGTGGYLNSTGVESKWYLIRWGAAALVIGGAALFMISYTLVFVPRRD